MNSASNSAKDNFQLYLTFALPSDAQPVGGWHQAFMPLHIADNPDEPANDLQDFLAQAQTITQKRAAMAQMLSIKPERIRIAAAGIVLPGGQSWQPLQEKNGKLILAGADAQPFNEHVRQKLVHPIAALN